MQLADEDQAVGVPGEVTFAKGPRMIDCLDHERENLWRDGGREKGQGQAVGNIRQCGRETGMRA